MLPSSGRSGLGRYPDGGSALVADLRRRQEIGRNGWHSLGKPFRPVGACKDSLGFVHLNGVLTGGTPNTIAVVLPREYRPKFDKAFAVTGANGGAPVLEDIFLLPGGLVFARGSAKDAVGLDGVIFSAIRGPSGDGHHGRAL